MTSQGERFRRRALRRGYKVDEVDAFLDRVEATLEARPTGPPVASQEVDDVVFRVRFGGYDEWQVDVYLDRVARQLSELEERGVLGRAPAPDFEGGRGRAAAMEAPGRGPDPRDRRDPRDRDVPRELHDPRGGRDMPERELHDPRMRDPRDRELHDPRDPRGLAPRSGPPADPRDPRAMGGAPVDPRSGPPADPRGGPPERGRPEPPRPARGAAAPSGRERFAGPGDDEGFGHLAGGDDEGFGHLAPRDDFDERPRSRRSGGLYSGLSDLAGDSAAPSPEPTRPMSSPPAPKPPQPPQGEDRYGAPPPGRFDRPGEDRYGPSPTAEPTRPISVPPDPTRFGPPPEDRYAPPPPPAPDRPATPGDRFAPGDDDRYGPPPPMPPRGADPYGPPPRDERRATPGDRFAPPPPAEQTRPMSAPPDPGATQIQPTVPPPMGGRPGGPAGRSPYGEPPEQPGYGRGAGRDAFPEPGRHGRPEMTTEMRAPDSPFTGDDISRLDQIRRSFQPRRFGSGYDPSQVDRLFDAVAATMTGRATVPLSEAELDTSQFSLVQGGYFEAEVDAALREIRDTFARRGLMRLGRYGPDGRYR